MKNFAYIIVVMFCLMGCKKNTVESPVAPATGLYASTQFAASEIKTYLNIPYATRPNYKGIQYTSETTKKEEKDKPLLTMKLDVGVPPNAVPGKLQPLIMYIHGGGFENGTKELFWDNCMAYAKAGYAVATINYRLTPDNQANPTIRLMAITHATEDAMNAIRFLKKNAATYFIDTNRIVTIGSSAGGGISLINAVAFDELTGAVSDYSGFSAKVAGAISTGATLLDATIPGSGSLLHFTSTDSPVLLYHANPTDSFTGATWNNNVIPTQNAINNSGNTCKTVAQPDMTHTVNLTLGGPNWDTVKQFLWTKLKL